MTNSVGQKRKSKTLNRTGKVYKKPQPSLSKFGILLKKAQYQIKNDIRMSDAKESLDKDNLFKELEKTVSSIYPLIGVIIFVSNLIKQKVIPLPLSNINLVELFKEYISIKKRLTTLPLLDDDLVFSTEIFEVAEKVENMTNSLYLELNRVGKYANIIDMVIRNCASALPPKEKERSKNEEFNETISIIIEDFLNQNGFIEDKNKEVSE